MCTQAGTMGMGTPDGVATCKVLRRVVYGL